MKATCSALAACFVLIGCAPSEQSTSPAELTGINSLIAHPDLYDGKLVRIRGAAVVRFEASFVCADAAISDPDQLESCLWLVPGDVDGKAFDLRPLHGNLVELVGRFNPKYHGHMGAFGGTIAPVWSKVTGKHGLLDVPQPPPPPPPLESSANNSFKPKPLRGST